MTPRPRAAGAAMYPTSAHPRVESNVAGRCCRSGRPTAVRRWRTMRSPRRRGGSRGWRASLRASALGVRRGHGGETGRQVVVAHRDEAGISACVHGRSVTQPSLSGGVGQCDRRSGCEPSQSEPYNAGHGRPEVSAAYVPTGDQPRAIAELAESVTRGDRFQTLLGRDRHRQDPHRRAAARRGAEADASDRPQQDAGRPAVQRVSRVSAAQRGRVLRLVLRLLPAGGLPAGVGHLHREGLLDQRRHRPACGTPPPPPCSRAATW